MNTFICLNCNKEYTSRKPNSKWCSIQCKKEYNNFEYNCDYCGKHMVIPRHKYIKVAESNKKCYCSKECANNGLVNSSEKECLNCGNTFLTPLSTKDSSKFCCRDCFVEYRDRNARKNIPRVCRVCNNTFYSDRANPKFCSPECCALSQHKREVCECEYCGKQFERIISEIGKNQKHYCSKLCKQMDQKWDEHDVQILIDNYRKIPTKDIIPLLSKPYNEKAIRSEAGRRDLWKSRLWSDEEIQILFTAYPTKPLKEVMALLPNRTMNSIIDRAVQSKIPSFFNNQRRYSQEDILYLQENYLVLNNKQLAEHLNRTPESIQQKLWFMGLSRPFDPKAVCYRNLSDFIRGQIAAWRNHVFKINNYTCCLTGKRGDVVVHHCHGFNLLLQEAVGILDFEIKDDFSDYQSEELEKLLDCFLDLQERYKQYVCISKDIHKLFHDTYGYGNNTMEQWIEFEKDYKDGKYKDIA